VDRVEKLLGVENVWENYAFVHHLDNALKAKELYKRDDHYLVSDGEIKIVDEFTGRVLPGRRYSEGLHQAIEAKENVEVKRESRTLATITFQNLFRLYTFLAGMTGTALTEAEEFAKIYKLEVIVVPTNKPVVRKDFPDVVFRTKAGKFQSVVQEIKGMYEEGRPVLVGTASVDNSEYLSDLLNKEGIPHEVLNAKQHQKEAMIVAKAGQKGMVTISTNMAGRGTDIALGEGVVDLGGLHVLGTERHESRRIDNQLRGRSGRQGDPGSSRFYTSFEDDLMRIFGGDTMGSIMERVGMSDDMPIEAGLIGKSIESAQKKVESHNFDTRKHLVEYDDVLNQQREIIYDLRRKILTILSSQKNETDDEYEKPRKLNDVKFDWKALSKENIDAIVEQARVVSLKDPSTWKWDVWAEYVVLEKPLRQWVMRLAVQYIDFIIDAQTKDDAKMDSKEEVKVLAGALDVVPLDLAKICAEKLGFASWESFEKEFNDNDDVDYRRTLLYRLLFAAYVIHILTLGDAVISDVERVLILQTIDNLWVEHLDLMTDLRHGIELRGYAQRDPLVEYKNEGFTMFERMLRQMEDNIIRRFFKVRVVERAPTADIERAAAIHEDLKGPTPTSAASQLPMPRRDDRAPLGASSADRRPGDVSKQKTVVNAKKVGRNDPCPCGSGKKYKKCCYPKYE
jgi:preprotein translocase subunit SecA